MNTVERDLLATLDSASGALKSCRRLAAYEKRELERTRLEDEVADAERDLKRARDALLVFHQHANAGSPYVECSVPAGVRLGDYRKGRAA